MVKSQQSNTVTEVSENEGWAVAMPDEDGGVIHYKFKVSVIPVTDKEFAVYAMKQDWRSDPDVYISTKANTKPDLTAAREHTISCNAYGSVNCLMSLQTLKANFRANDYIYFDVKCEKKCNADVRVALTDTITFQIGDALEYTMDETQVEVFRFNASLNESMKNTTTEMLINFDLENWSDLNASQTITLIVEGEPYLSINGQTNWAFGQSFIITTADNPDFWGNKVFVAEVEAEEGAIFNIQFEAYNKYREISVGDLVNDASTWQQPRTFKIKYTDDFNDTSSLPTQDLVLDVQPYHGWPTIYLNFDGVPDDLFESVFRYDEWNGEELIVFTPKMWQDNNPQENYIYVTIGYSTSTFSLYSYFTNTTDLWLWGGYSRVGQVDEGEMLSYNYIVWGSDPETIDFTMVQTDSYTDANMDLFVLLCNSTDDKSDCEITKEKIDSIYANLENLTSPVKNDELDTSPNLWFSLGESWQETIRVQYDNTSCTLDDDDNSIQYCRYKVVVYGRNGTSQYQITATQDNSITPLKENQPQRYMIAEGETQYYVFNIQNDTNTDGAKMGSVSFSTTLITGDITMFVSTTEKFPDYGSYDKVSYYGKPITFDNYNGFLDLNGTYYVAIRAYDASYYSIRTQTRYLDADGNHQVKIIPLHEGVVETVTMEDYMKAEFFKFDIELPQDSDESITVMIDPLTGQYDLTCDTSRESLIDTPQFSSWMSNSLTIGEYSWQTVENTTYLCKVELTDKNSTEESNTTSFQFRIIYTIGTPVHTLDHNTGMDYVVQKTSFSYFELWVSSLATNVIIYQSSDYCLTSDCPAVYVSYNNANQRPNPEKFDLNGTDQANVFNIQNADFNSTCMQMYGSKTDESLCKIFISIENKNDTENITGTIYNFEGESYYNVRSSVSSYIRQPEKDEPKYIYYKPTLNGRPVEIVGSSDYKLHGYLDVQVISERDQTKWAWPNKTHHRWSFKSQNYGEFGRQISYDKLNKTCHSKDNQTSNTSDVDGGIYWEDYNQCVVLLTLISNETLTAYQEAEFPTVLLDISQDEVDLKDGVTKTYNVEMDQIKFFKFVVPEGKKEMMLNLYTENGESVMGLMRYGGGVPRWDRHHWLVTSWETDEQVISKANYPNNFRHTKNDSIAGVYRIAVYAFEPAKFSIVASCFNTRVFQLKAGRPMEMPIGKESWIYFMFEPDHNWRYNNETEEWEEFGQQNFEVSINEEFGVVSMFIKQYQRDTEDWIDYLPSTTNYTWSQEEQDFKEVIDINYWDDDNVKTGAPHLYVIGVHSNFNTSRFNINAKYPWQAVHIDHGHTFTDFHQKGSVLRYYTGYYDKRDLEIQVTTFYGDITVYAGFYSPENWYDNREDYTFNAADFPFSVRVNQSERYGDVLLPVDQFPEDIKDELNQEGTKWSEIFIVVAVNEDSEYELLIDRQYGSKFNKLDAHTPAHFTLKPMKTTKYIFWVGEDMDKDLIISLEMDHSLQFQDLELLSTLIKYSPADQGRLLSQSYKNFNLTEEQFHTLHYPGDLERNDERDIRFYKLKPKKGAYLIAITNMDPTQNMKLALSQSTSDFKDLMFNHRINDRVQVGNYKTFAINTQKPGMIDVNVNNCLGNIMLYGTRSRLAVLNQDFSQADVTAPFESTDSDTHKRIQLTEPGTYYLTIYGVSGFNETDDPDFEAYYQLQVSFGEELNSYDQLPLIPGNEGMIEYDYNDKKELTISWTSPIFAGIEQAYHTNSRYEWVETTILCSDNSDFVEMGCKCMYTLDVFNQSDIGKYEVYLHNKDENQEGLNTHQVDDSSMKYTFFCKVSEIFKDTTVGDQKKVFYNLVQVEKPIIATRYYYLGALVLVGALAVLFCILLCQRKQLKRVKETLEYEKQDVRNIAHIELEEVTKMTENDIDDLQGSV